MDFQLKKYYINVSDEELLNDLKRVAGILNKNTVKFYEYSDNSEYSSPTIVKRLFA